MDGSCEFVVGVLSESKRVGDIVMVWLRLRNFHLDFCVLKFARGKVVQPFRLVPVWVGSG